MPKKCIAPDSVEIEIVHVRTQGRHGDLPNQIEFRITRFKMSSLDCRPEPRVEADIAKFCLARRGKPRKAERPLGNLNAPALLRKGYRRQRKLFELPFIRISNLSD